MFYISVWIENLCQDYYYYIAVIFEIRAKAKAVLVVCDSHTSHTFHCTSLRCPTLSHYMSLQLIAEQNSMVSVFL